MHLLQPRLKGSPLDFTPRRSKKWRGVGPFVAGDEAPREVVWNVEEGAMSDVLRLFADEAVVEGTS